jgi:hypothetical protein
MNSETCRPKNPAKRLQSSVRKFDIVRRDFSSANKCVDRRLGNHSTLICFAPINHPYLLHHSIFYRSSHRKLPHFEGHEVKSALGQAVSYLSILAFDHPNSDSFGIFTGEAKRYTSRPSPCTQLETWRSPPRDPHFCVKIWHPITSLHGRSDSRLGHAETNEPHVFQPFCKRSHRQRLALALSPGEYKSLALSSAQKLPK